MYFNANGNQCSSAYFTFPIKEKNKKIMQNIKKQKKNGKTKNIVMVNSKERTKNKKRKYKEKSKSSLNQSKIYWSCSGLPIFCALTAVGSERLRYSSANYYIG